MRKRIRITQRWVGQGGFSRYNDEEEAVRITQRWFGQGGGEV